VLRPIPSDVPMIGNVANAGYAISANSAAPISPGAWMMITGANLSSTTRSWTTADFQGSALPLSLDDVSVTVNGIPAAVSYINPVQINAQCPDIPLTGASTT